MMENYECGVCLEDIKPKNTKMRFGLLSACNHVFCFACLKEWKKVKQDVVQCPECLGYSRFVISSKKFLTGKKKSEVVKKLRLNPSSQLCLVSRQADIMEKKHSRFFWIAPLILLINGLYLACLGLFTIFCAYPQSVCCCSVKSYGMLLGGGVALTLFSFISVFVQKFFEN